jgi:thymidylate synthase (FAD)
MKIKTYDDIDIQVIKKTAVPCKIINIATKITMGGPFHDANDANWVPNATEEKIKFLYLAGHTSLFEHCNITFYIQGVSRNLVMQLTRHRMAAYTVSSQHYQDYSDYDMVVSPKMAEIPEIEDLLVNINWEYANHIKDGKLKPEEARQILPGAKGNHLLWTINARSLANFLNLRLCKRNTLEMLTFANKIEIRALEWFPELFKYVNADCKEENNKCKQRRMACNQE